MKKVVYFRAVFKTCLVLYSLERAWCTFLKGVWRNEATCIHIVYNNPNRLVYFKIKIVSVDRNFLKSKFSFMLHLLKTNFIKCILSFIYHSIKTIFFFFSPVMLRWWQQGGYPYNFGLDDVYVGPPCKENCHRNGVCEASNCVCDAGFQGMKM